MATEQHKFKGTVKWSYVFKPDVYLGKERYVTNFYFESDKEVEKFKSIGSQLKLFEDDDGIFIKPRRDVEKLINGEIIVFCPPVLTGQVQVSYVDDDDNPVYSYVKGTLEPRMVGTPITVGNDSKVEITVSTYNTQMGKGTRLEKIEVLDLVEYVRPSQEGEDANEESPKESASKTSKEKKLPW